MNSKLLSIVLFSISMLFMVTLVAQQNQPAKVKMERTDQISAKEASDIVYYYKGAPDKEKEKPTVTITSSNLSPTPENPHAKQVQSNNIVIPESRVDVTKKIEITEDAIYYTVNEMPAYIDGKRELPNYVSRTAKYPYEAGRDKAQGVVIVQFIVEKDGSISNPKVIQSVHPKLDEEALRVIGTLKGFTPGKQNGEAVRCYYQIPVPFVLVPSAK